MKKILVALALAAFAQTAMAAIAGSSHDMTTRGGNLPACQYCHAPHLFVATNLGGAPLWNRNASANVLTGLTRYSTATLGATPNLGSGQAANTKTCLTCHDGVTGFSAVNNGTGSAITNNTTTGRFNIGTDLTNDHPVGMNYNGGSDYRTVAAATALGMVFYTNTVQCASCHDPHGLGGSNNFLRDTTDICANCHIK